MKVADAAVLLDISLSAVYELIEEWDATHEIGLQAIRPPGGASASLTGTTTTSSPGSKQAAAEPLGSYRLARPRTAFFLARLGPASYQRRSVSSLFPVIDATVR